MHNSYKKRIIHYPAQAQALLCSAKTNSTVMCAHRFATLGRYTTWELILKGWKEGICNKQTVPLEQLERELQEGLQLVDPNKMTELCG